MLIVRKRLLAKRDLIEHFVYLEEYAGIKVAEKFLTNADAGFHLLATKPLLGSPLNSEKEELAGLRKWRVKDFEKVLIFYQPLSDGISIVRILHAARDWWRLLDCNE